MRGSTKSFMDDCERTCHDAICSLRALCDDQRVLPGAGCIETKLSLYLQKCAEETTGIEQ